MIKVAIIVVSDRSYKGERDDRSGSVLHEWATSKGYMVAEFIIVPDERQHIANTLRELAAKKIDVVITTGGTGCSPRDVTPEATFDVIEREVPGVGEQLRNQSLQYTRHAMLSRGIAGIRGSTLIINLPGSPKAVRESLEVIDDIIHHVVDLLRGNVKDCGHQ